MDGFSRTSFLIIDGNPHLASVLRVLLAAFGARAVRQCTDLLAAKDMALRDPPDVLILDDGVPPKGGIAFARDVRGAGSEAPIVLVTAHAGWRKLGDARDAGINEVLVKPMMAHDFRIAIEGIVLYPRPFIRITGYAGPCRRRDRAPYYDGLERRQPGTLFAAEARSGTFSS